MCVLGALCAGVVEAGVVSALEPPRPSSIMLAPSPTAATSPTIASTLTCGLIEVFTSPPVPSRQLTVQVPGVKSVPTEMLPLGPC